MEKDFKKMLEEQIAKEKLIKEKYITKVRLIILTFEIIIGFIGWVILVSKLGWLVGLGVLFILAANNLTIYREIYKKRIIF